VVTHLRRPVMCISTTDWFSKPSQTHQFRSNRTSNRPSRESSRTRKSRNSSRQSNQSIHSQDSNESLHSDQSGSLQGRNSKRSNKIKHVMSLDDMIDLRISELNLPGLEGRRSKQEKKVGKNWKIVQEHTVEGSEELEELIKKLNKEAIPKETTEEKLRRTREARKSQKERKLSNTSLRSKQPDRNSVTTDTGLTADCLLEDSVLEDLCETTGVESRNNCSILRFYYFVIMTHFFKVENFSSKDKLQIFDEVSKTIKKEEIKVDEPVLTEAKRAQKEAKRMLMREIVLTVFCLS